MSGNDRKKELFEQIELRQALNNDINKISGLFMAVQLEPSAIKLTQALEVLNELKKEIDTKIVELANLDTVEDTDNNVKNIYSKLIYFKRERKDKNDECK